MQHRADETQSSLLGTHIIFGFLGQRAKGRVGALQESAILPCSLFHVLFFVVLRFRCLYANRTNLVIHNVIRNKTISSVELLGARTKNHC